MTENAYPVRGVRDTQPSSSINWGSMVLQTDFHYSSPLFGENNWRTLEYAMIGRRAVTRLYNWLEQDVGSSFAG